MDSSCLNISIIIHVLQEAADLHIAVPVLPSVRADPGAIGDLDKPVARQQAETETLKLRQQLASVAISGGPRWAHSLFAMQQLLRCDTSTKPSYRSYCLAKCMCFFLPCNFLCKEARQGLIIECQHTVMEPKL